MNDTIAEFAAHLRESEKAAATVEKYVRDVKSFFAFLNACHCEERSDVAHPPQRASSEQPRLRGSWRVGMSSKGQTKQKL